MSIHVHTLHHTCVNVSQAFTSPCFKKYMHICQCKERQKHLHKLVQLEGDKCIMEAQAVEEQHKFELLHRQALQLQEQLHQVSHVLSDIPASPVPFSV